MFRFDFAAARVAGFRLVPVGAGEIGADGVQVVPIDLGAWPGEGPNQRGQPIVARFGVAEQPLVMDGGVAGRLFDRDAARGTDRQADAVGVALDLSVALAVGEALEAEDIRQEPAGGIARLHIGVHIFDEVVLVALRGVDARRGVAAPVWKGHNAGKFLLNAHWVPTGPVAGSTGRLPAGAGGAGREGPGGRERGARAPGR